MHETNEPLREELAEARAGQLVSEIAELRAELAERETLKKENLELRAELAEHETFFHRQVSMVLIRLKSR